MIKRITRTAQGDGREEEKSRGKNENGTARIDDRLISTHL